MRGKEFDLPKEDRPDTLTFYVGEIFHKATRLNSILEVIEKRITGHISTEERKETEPSDIKSYVYSSGQSLDEAITLAERIKDIL